MGSATARVNWIDKEVPTAVLTYSTTGLTNKNVTVTVQLSKEEAYITNNNGNKTYTFTENGSFTFGFTDQAGNNGTITASVNWIDKVAPTANVNYSERSQTKNPVTATLTDESEEITVINNNGSKTYIFTENRRIYIRIC